MKPKHGITPRKRRFNQPRAAETDSGHCQKRRSVFDFVLPPHEMIKRLAHVCLATDRPREMIAFYRDLLELPVKFALRHADGTAFGWYFDLGDQTFLEIFEQKGAVREWGGEVVPLRANTDTCYRHYCLQINGLEAWRKALCQRGASITEIVTGMDHSKQCWIQDPDGNRIELMEYTPKSLQTQPSEPA